jgi:hypothetical protein
MIRYALTCDNDDRFEGWFASSADYDSQEAGGRIECPLCGSTSVRKAPMAPAIARGKSAEASMRAKFEAMAREVQAHVRDNFDYVGEKFADEARAMHDGAADHRPIWGEATAQEARDMIEEGVPVAPLPAPFAPIPPTKLN